eukprot:GCRY01004584.1.p1 GENE.GCRY01004584.1~~GCRY01004584.1.p1  ORF type:complete len:274 (-),score=27.83 GCRY01004584.1:49-870(-)
MNDSVETFKRVYPDRFFHHFLSKNIRPDGRGFMKGRQVALFNDCISTAEGSSLVRLGKTSVLAVVKCEIAEPKIGNSAGYFVPHVELSSLSSPNFRSGRPGEIALSISSLIHRLVVEGEILSLDTLQVFPDSPHEFAWSIYCDIFCISFDGNLQDACVLAAMSALSQTKMPLVELTDEGAIQVVAQKHSPLKLSYFPLSVSFGVIDDKLLLDLTEEEEELAVAVFSVFVSADTCFIQKMGGSPLSKDDLKTVLTHAKERASDLRGLFKDGQKS